jgi:hypothetical protein
MRFLALVILLATGMVARAADHTCRIDVDRVTFSVELSDGHTYPVIGRGRRLCASKSPRSRISGIS